MSNTLSIILASGSPRRRELLQGLGWDIRIVVPEIDETPIPSESPESLCLRLSAEKAAKVAALFGKEFSEEKENALVIAADTIVVVDGDILGKPSGNDDSVWDESVSMVKRLQGRSHEVLTGVSVIANDQVMCELERTTVTFRPLSDAAIRAYADTKEGADKAGAYAIQGMGSLLVSSIEGDYFNVVGLPLCKLSQMLEEMGISLPAQWGR